MFLTRPPGLPLSLQADSRRSAAVLLRTMLALAGDAAHQHVQQLVPALCRSVAIGAIG